MTVMRRNRGASDVSAVRGTTSDPNYGHDRIQGWTNATAEMVPTTIKTRALVNETEAMTWFVTEDTSGDREDRVR